MSDPIEVDPNVLDWTPAALRALRYMPIVAGDDYEIRYQFLDEDGAAIDLTGAVITLTISHTSPFTRISATAIVGLAPAANQIDVDNQTTEDSVNFSGTGWITIRFSRASGDRNALAAMGSVERNFDLLAVWDGETRRTQARGKIAFLAPISA
jgi:hypothetical protein